MRRPNVLVCCALAVLVVTALTLAGQVSAQEIRARTLGHAPGKAEMKIRAALESPTHVDFRDTPFSEAVQFLADLQKIEIQLDQRALDEVGIPPDTPITMCLTGVSLESTVDLILRQHDLTWIVWDEVLLITTPDKAAESMTTNVYDLTGLFGHDASASDSLVSLITDTIDPTSWCQGGPGAIVTLRTEGLHVLVITQTQKVQWRIDELLKTLADFKATPTPAKR